MKKRSNELPSVFRVELIDLLSNVVSTLDFIKDLSEFKDLDHEITMRLSLIRSLSDQVLINVK